MNLHERLTALLAAASPEPWTWNRTRYIHAPMRSKPDYEHVILLASRENSSPDEDAALASLAPILARCTLALMEALTTAESWIESELSGTRQMEPALAKLVPARAALAELEQALGAHDG